MLRWILAAVGVFVLSVAISAAHMQLSGAPESPPPDQAAFERSRLIESQYEQISLVSLLAVPERYDGRKVRVSGFVTLEFEGRALHLDRRAYEAGLRKNAVWLDSPEWLTPNDAQGLDRRYGEVAGTFVAARHGAYGLYSGTLTELRRIQPSFTQADYQTLRVRETRAAVMQHVFSGWFLTTVGWLALAILWVFTRRTR